MIPRQLVNLALLLGGATGALAACSEQDSLAPVIAPHGVEHPGPLSRPAPGSYELSFVSGGQAVSTLPVCTESVCPILGLKAAVEDAAGAPAQSGTVTFQYCSLKGLPPNDIERADDTGLARDHLRDHPRGLRELGRDPLGVADAQPSCGELWVLEAVRDLLDNATERIGKRRAAIGEEARHRDQAGQLLAALQQLERRITRALRIAMSAARRHEPMKASTVARAASHQPVARCGAAARSSSLPWTVFMVSSASPSSMSVFGARYSGLSTPE